LKLSDLQWKILGNLYEQVHGDSNPDHSAEGWIGDDQLASNLRIEPADKEDFVAALIDLCKRGLVQYSMKTVMFMPQGREVWEHAPGFPREKTRRWQKENRELLLLVSDWLAKHPGLARSGAIAESLLQDPSTPKKFTRKHIFTRIHDLYDGGYLEYGVALETKMTQLGWRVVDGIHMLNDATAFESKLNQARELNEKGYKDQAATTVRVVLEDALGRLSKDNGLDDSKSGSNMNDALKVAKVYSKFQWRLVQVYQDLGNDAAHNLDPDITQEDVADVINGVEKFIFRFFVP